TVALGAAVSAAGVLTVASGAAAGAAGSGAGVVAVSDGALAGAAALAAAGAAGVMTVSGLVLTVATSVAAAPAQCSEIMLSSVTARLLSAIPELTAPLALCPTSFTSWPRCGLRSTLLVVILKIWPVLSSATV